MTRIRSPWRAVAAMFLLNGALFGIWASRIPAIAARFDLSEGALGLLLLCLAGGAILGFPLAGRAADRFGAAPVTRSIAIAYAFALPLIGLAPSVSLLALALLAFGVAHGAMDVTMNAWAAEVETASGRPMMGSFHAMFSVGAGLGAASGALAAAATLGVVPHFSGMAMLLLAVTLWMAYIPWNSTRSPETASSPLAAWPRGPLLLVGIVAFCSSLGEGALADWSAIFLVDVTAATEAQAALGYAVFSLAMVAMRLLGDPLVARFGAGRVARASAITASLGAALAVTGLDVGAVLAGFALMGLGYAVIVPLAFSRAARDRVLKPGAAIASVATLGYGGLLAGPPVIGFVAEASSLQTAFSILLVLALLMALLAGVLEQRAAA